MFDDSNITNTPEHIQDITSGEGPQRVVVEPFAIRATNHNGNFTLESHRAGSPDDLGYIILKDEHGQFLASFLNAYVMDFYLFGQVDQQTAPVSMDPYAKVSNSDPTVSTQHDTVEVNAGKHISDTSSKSLDIEVREDSSKPAAMISTTKTEEPLVSTSALYSAITSEDHDSLKGKAAEQYQSAVRDEEAVTLPGALSVLDKIFTTARNELSKFFSKLSEGCDVGDADHDLPGSVPQNVEGQASLEYSNNSIANDKVEEDVGNDSTDVHSYSNTRGYNYSNNSQVSADETADAVQEDENEADSTYTADQLEKLAVERGAAFVVAASGVAAMEALEEGTWFTKLHLAETATESAAVKGEDNKATEGEMGVQKLQREGPVLEQSETSTPDARREREAFVMPMVVEDVDVGVVDVASVTTGPVASEGEEFVQTSRDFSESSTQDTVNAEVAATNMSEDNEEQRSERGSGEVAYLQTAAKVTEEAAFEAQDSNHMIVEGEQPLQQAVLEVQSGIEESASHVMSTEIGTLTDSAAALNAYNTEEQLSHAAHAEETAVMTQEDVNAPAVEETAAFNANGTGMAENETHAHDVPAPDLSDAVVAQENVQAAVAVVGQDKEEESLVMVEGAQAVTAVTGEIAKAEEEDAEYKVEKTQVQYVPSMEFISSAQYEQEGTLSGKLETVTAESGSVKTEPGHSEGSADIGLPLSNEGEVSRGYDYYAKLLGADDVMETVTVATQQTDYIDNSDHRELGAYSEQDLDDMESRKPVSA